MKTFKTLTVGLAALSVLATAGMASAAPAPQRGHQERGHDNRNDFRDYDRRADRHFKADRYSPPRGYKTRHWGRGERLPSAYRGRGYVVDYNRYNLRAPPRGYQYVRVGNDVVLTAITTGLIAAVVADLFN